MNITINKIDLLVVKNIYYDLYLTVVLFNIPLFCFDWFIQ